MPDNNIRSIVARELRKEGFRTFEPFARKNASFGEMSKSLAVKVALRVIHRMSSRSTIRELRSLSPEQRDVPFLIDYLTNRFLGLIRPSQVRSEFTALASLVKERKPKTVLEVGTFKGGTLFLFARLAAPGATLVSVDLPGGVFGGGYPKWKSRVYKSFSPPGQTLHLLRANSHTIDTFERVRTLFGDMKVDLLFIDADHTYEGVKRDYELYSPLVGDDGIVAFHDIVPHPPQYNCGVDIFWNEIKRPSSREFIENPNQGWAGIGIL